jgi:hypothetical protein
MTWFLSFFWTLFYPVLWRTIYTDGLAILLFGFFIFSVISFRLDLKLSLRKQMDKQTTTVWKFPGNVCWWSQYVISSNKYHFFPLTPFFFDNSFTNFHFIGKRNKNEKKRTKIVFFFFFFFFKATGIDVNEINESASS